MRQPSTKNLTSKKNSLKIHVCGKLASRDRNFNLYFGIVDIFVKYFLDVFQVHLRIHTKDW